MDMQRRMSPLTAMFLGIWIVGGVAIVSGTAITLYALDVVDGKISTILAFAEGTVENLPALIETLPDAIGTALNDRRAPDYADKIQVEVQFVSDDRSGRLRPALTIKNLGDEVVSMLAVRAVALADGRVPVGEWTEVVATPLALANGWRGPLMPGSTRYVLIGGRGQGVSLSEVENITGAIEISELRLWNGDSTRARADGLADASLQKFAGTP